MREVLARPAGRVPHRHARRSPVLLIALLGVLALAATPASAENVHVLTQTITGAPGTNFNFPRKVAVDNSSGLTAGSIYVADSQNRRIVKFAPNGQFDLMWGHSVNEGTGNPDICTSVGPPANICTPSQGFGSGAGSFFNLNDVAVDGSSGPSAGDVYTLGDGVVQKFDPTGHIIASWGGTPFPGGMEGFSQSCCTLQAITVDPNGNLYVQGAETLYKFSENGTPQGSIVTGSQGVGIALDAAGNVFKINGAGFNSGPLEKFGPTNTNLGRVDVPGATSQDVNYYSSNSDLVSVVSSPAVRIYHFNGSGEVVQPNSSTCALSPSGCGATETFGGSEEFNFNPQGVAMNSATGTVYVANTNANNVRVFDLINAPKVTTGAATNVTRTSVSFNGNVDPDGAGNVTSCAFEYGVTKAYSAGSVPCIPATTAAPTAVSADLPAETLAAETEYHFRLVAGNGNGTRSGADMTFTTPPAVAGVTTEGAEDVARLTATLKGSFTGDGVDTSYYFEYGPTTAYGQKTSDFDQGTAGGTQSVSASLTGLYAYYTYHYRLVAHNKYGKNVGGDQVFMTLAPDLPVVESTFPSSVDATSATVNAEIDPGEGLTVYRFEYGADTTYGIRTLIGPPIDPNGNAHTVSAELSELAPGTTYHFRAVAINVAGNAFGPDETFTTPSPPSVEPGAATGITRTTATLSSLVNPGLSLTTYHFEYGPSVTYGSRTAESSPIGPDSASHAASAAISGLAPGTVYHFRLVATNPIGTTHGLDKTFTTQAPEGQPEEEKTRPCRKGFVRKHGKCVRKHRRHHKRHHRHVSHRHG